MIRLAVVDSGYTGKEAHYSLSVGDTVTVDGKTVAVESFGFKEVRACDMEFGEHEHNDAECERMLYEMSYGAHWMPTTRSTHRTGARPRSRCSDGPCSPTSTDQPQCNSHRRKNEMAKITHVKAAQQRYETVPVIDPATGQQKETPVMGRDGKQKVTKRGRPVVRRLTTEDRTKPKANLKCDFPTCTDNEIKPGQPYKHISPKSGPYGGRQLNRHEEHPSWQVWEYSSSLSARLSQISHDFWTSFDSISAEEGAADEVESILSSTADEVRSLAEEKRESASNIEEGFGHPTSSSEELEQVADDLESWADDIEGADLPEFPEPEAEDRFYIVNAADGTHVEDNEGGYEDESEAQASLDSMVEDGQGAEDEFEVVTEDYTPEEPTEEQVSDWMDEARDACSIVDESPV